MGILEIFKFGMISILKESAKVKSRYLPFYIHNKNW